MIDCVENSRHVEYSLDKDGDVSMVNSLEDVGQDAQYGRLGRVVRPICRLRQHQQTGDMLTVDDTQDVPAASR